MAKFLRTSGFTIIEVLIWIAIVALIIVIIFLAVGQAEHNRKDDTRIADAQRYLTAAKQWVSENNGLLPDNQVGPTNYNDPATGIEAKYITPSSAKFVDPEGDPWMPQFGDSAHRNPAAFANPSQAMVLGVGGACDANGWVPGSGDNRQLAVVIQLEGGQIYCVSS